MAVAIPRSSAPGSSGFGKATVGKSGSGSTCCSTSTTGANPAAANARRMVAAPTPCMAVYAAVTVRSVGTRPTWDAAST